MPAWNHWRPDLADTPSARHQYAVDGELEEVKAECRKRYSARVYEVMAAYRKLVGGQGKDRDNGQSEDV